MRQPTIRRSVTTVTLVTTFIALMANAIALTVPEYRESQLARAGTQAQVLARATAAALAFEDRREAATSLAVLREDPTVAAAALYRPDGSLFASYVRGREALPATPGELGMREEGDRIAAFHEVREGSSSVGRLYLSTEYGLYARLYRYVGLLVVVMAGALVVALLLSNTLQRAVTQPILAVTAAARRVVESNDYTVRAQPQAGYETGLLAEAFNRMLSEIDRRASEILREMREREHAEEALRAADRQKDRFLATLAHELRNPLAPITSSLQILKQKGGSDPDLVYARDVVDRQVRHMSRLLDDLLEVGRITNDKLELRLQRITLASVVHAALETSRPLIEQGGHRLVVELPPEDLHLDADPVRMAQVVSNLLNNAARYSNAGGTIELQASREGREAVVRVRDNGIGIAAQELPGLFDIFSQAATAQRHAGGGLGLGLFLVKSLVALHGGSVAAHSDGAGRGSEFTVRLPLAPAPAAASQPPAEAGAPGKRRILVVDDNVDAATSLALMLSMTGNELQVAHGGQEALDKAAAFRPDVVLLDIGMPEMDGYETARRMRATDWGSVARLVALTGWGQDADRRRAFEAGFDNHIVKPARPETVFAVL
jgi:signal transduction histidine kinase